MPKQKAPSGNEVPGPCFGGHADVCCELRHAGAVDDDGADGAADMMQLALRTTAATDANWMARLFCWIIRVALVSRYCHGGVVIDGVLYHTTATSGSVAVPAGQWNPERWALRDVPARCSAEQALIAFNAVRGRHYGWVLLPNYVPLIAPILRSLLGVFVRAQATPVCFVLAARMLGVPEGELETPELLLDWVSQKEAI